ncbi:MAG: TIGR03960 family B12-binding radical SAM protein [Candidatus Omnitrophota bacterium]
MLDSVYKPGRYINMEWNSVRKESRDGLLKFALCFPDIYEIGMSHLGLRILYGILNNEKDVACERVFAPWGDMETELRSRKERLFSLEGRRPLSEFDVIGFSLQYEMNYPDVLNMLDLGGVPLRAGQRDDSHPLVIAGGPCAFNPEPLADFIDAFVIGEAEEVVLEIVKILRDTKTQRHKDTRSETLRELAKIEGVYVPAVNPRPAVRRRIVRDLDNAYFPTRPVVPYIQIVHDRIGIEIMRGCVHKCRFCQARRIFQPLRIRSIKRIMEIAEESIKNTGYEELSLLSLSSGDYPHIEELAAALESKFRPMGVQISLPSLRVGSFNEHGKINVLKRAGLTFAPEAGSERLRDILNKDIKDKEIVEKSALALRSGWKKVKLYFMIGLPGETREDLDAIVGLVSKIKRSNLSVSPFIPKPHSDFEREGMEGLDVLREKQQRLASGIRSQVSGKGVKVDFHSAEMSRVEAILARGDRAVGEVIFRVWQKGARAQAWTERFNYGTWEESLQEAGIDPGPYLSKRGPAEDLPWGFVKLEP